MLNINNSDYLSYIPHPPPHFILFQLGTRTAPAVRFATSLMESNSRKLRKILQHTEMLLLRAVADRTIPVPLLSQQVVVPKTHVRI